MKALVSELGETRTYEIPIVSEGKDPLTEIMEKEDKIKVKEIEIKGEKFKLVEEVE